MKMARLVFIPSPGFGDLVATTEFAKLLTNRHDRLFITVLVMKLPFGAKSTTDTKSPTASTISGRIQFIELPSEERDSSAVPINSLFSFIETQKPHVKEAVSNFIQSKFRSESPRLAGFVLDMFSATMIEAANEFHVPSYIFFMSNAAFLGFTFYIQAIHDKQKQDLTEFKDSDAQLAFPSFVNPLPARVLPSIVLDKDLLLAFLGNIRRYRETKGIIINTFMELESRGINYLCNGKNPSVYPVGPILKLEGTGNDGGLDGSEKYKEIMQWLDHQPPSSVVFLCFGSMGSFGVDQVKEIASALQQTEHRFLWSLRKPPPRGKMELPSDYTDLLEVLL